MAENLENQSFGNFSIQDTMEMGMGNQQLLNDLLSPDTASASPDDIKVLTADDKLPQAPAKQKATSTKGDDDADVDKPDPAKSIQDFLLADADDDDDEDNDEPSSVVTQKTTTVDNDDEDAEVSKFAALSTDLFKLGVFNKSEDEDDVVISTPEEFLERFNEEKKKGAIEVVNNFIGQFGEDYQEAFDAIFVKGVNPKEYFSVYNSIQNFSEMDLSNEDNQKAVIKQALTDQGFEPEDVESEIERLGNYGDLESVATKHHKVLVKKEGIKLQDIEQKRTEELQQQAAYKNQYATNVNQVLQDKLKTKEFDGIPLNAKLASELQDFLVTDRYKTGSGEMLTEFDKTILELKRPENHEMKVKVALLLKILEKDPTLSTIQKTGITKKSNELFGEVARQASKSASKSSGVNSSKSWFS